MHAAAWYVSVDCLNHRALQQAGTHAQLLVVYPMHRRRAGVTRYRANESTTLARSIVNGPQRHIPMPSTTQSAGD